MIFRVEDSSVYHARFGKKAKGGWVVSDRHALVPRVHATEAVNVG